MLDRVSENTADFQASYRRPHPCFCLSDTHSREREKSVSVCQLQRSQLQDFDFMLFSFSKQPGGQHHRLLELLSGDNFQILAKRSYFIWIFLPSFVPFLPHTPTSFFLGGDWIRKGHLRILNSLEISSRIKKKIKTPKTNGDESCFLTAPRRICVCIWKKSISWLDKLHYFSNMAHPVLILNNQKIVF